MRIAFLQPAEDEFSQAIDYYNLQSEGLGWEFAAEAKRGLRRILRYPDAWTRLSKRTSRCRLNRFPYAILYQAHADLILIVAIQNLHKHPDSWWRRLGKGRA